MSWRDVVLALLAVKLALAWWAWRRRGALTLWAVRVLVAHGVRKAQRRRRREAEREAQRMIDTGAT